jgi:branched-chain amino acid transport system permease protein
MIKDRAASKRDLTALALFLAAIIAWLRADLFGHELLAQIAILAIFAISLDLLAGYTGLVSLGHAAFYGVGAYATAGLGVMAGWPMWLVMPSGMFLTALLAAVVGAFAVRLVGVFFLMITLAIGEMIHAFVFRSRLFGGDDGMGGVPRINLDTLGINLLDPTQFSLFTVFVAMVVYFVGSNKFIPIVSKFMRGTPPIPSSPPNRRLRNTNA